MALLAPGELIPSGSVAAKFSVFVPVLLVSIPIAEALFPVIR